MSRNPGSVLRPLGARLSYMVLVGAGLLSACGGEPELPGFDAGLKPLACTTNAETGGIEICNNVDDDCNGLVDDAMTGGALRQACSSACGGGTEQCVRGDWTGCTAREPTDEVCNGVDDNCDEQVDENCDCVHGETRACGDDEGACRAGIEQCVDGLWSSNCIGEVGPAEEICNNGIDDNCDTRIDEECQCMVGETQVCGTDEGQCTAGEIVCEAGSRWGDSCVGEVQPSTESCNFVDNDCDGAVDWNNATGFGWRPDALETNETCNQATALDTAVDGGVWVSVPVADPANLTTYPTMYPAADEDWYSFRAEEVSHTCVPGFSQCAFVFVVQLEITDPAAKDDYEVCFATQTCGMVNPDTLFCSNSGRWEESANSYVMAIKWEGVCGRDDSRDVRVVVRSKGNAQACGYYQLHSRFYFDDEQACP